MITLPVQHLGGPARKRKQLLVYSTQELPETAELIFHGIQFVSIFNFHCVAGLIFPITHEVPPAHYPAVSLNDGILQQTYSGRTHVANQLASLKNHVQWR